MVPIAQCHSLKRPAPQADIGQIDLDVDAEIGAALLDGVAEILEGDVAVLAGIAGDDEPAAAADQFVDAEVLEVPAVREIHPRPIVGGHAEQLAQQLDQRQPRAFVGPDLCPARVAQPPAEAHVENRHQERERRRGVIAHVGRGRSARGGHREADRERRRIVGVVAGAVRRRCETPPRAARLDVPSWRTCLRSCSLSSSTRYSKPQYSGEKMNDAALRCCHARFLPPTRLSATLKSG